MRRGSPAREISGLADMSGGDSEAYSGLKIGRALELARKRRGLSLKQVEEATKIRAGYLSDLERENFDVLPAVYVQGYLKTYASFLHLDADAMVGEFKRWRSLSEEPPYPLYVGPREDDSLDDILTAVSGAAGAKSRDASGDEEDAGPALLPAGFDGRLYLGSALFLFLCAAVVALALTVAGDRQPAVSQIREPLTSQAPETSPPGAAEDASVQSPQQDDKQKGTNEDNKQQSTVDEKDKSQSDRSASAADDKKTDPKPQNSASATAPASPAAETASAAEREDRRDLATAEPSRRDTAGVEAPARQDGTAPPSSPPPARQPGGAPSGGNSSPPPRNDGEVRVEVNVGGKDPVQLSGGPFDD